MLPSFLQFVPSRNFEASAKSSKHSSILDDSTRASDWANDFRFPQNLPRPSRKRNAAQPLRGTPFPAKLRRRTHPPHLHGIVRHRNRMPQREISLRNHRRVPAIPPRLHVPVGLVLVSLDLVIPSEARNQG